LKKLTKYYTINEGVLTLYNVIEALQNLFDGSLPDDINIIVDDLINKCSENLDIEEEKLKNIDMDTELVRKRIYEISKE